MKNIRNTVGLGLVLLLATIFSGVSVAQAQTKSNLSGTYSGTIANTLPLRLHLTAAADRSLSGTLDSPNQGVTGMKCDNFQLDGHNLSFSIPDVHGTWKGTVTDDGATLAGTWTQGNSIPLTFTRDTFSAAAKPSPVDGIWLGTAKEGDTSLRIQVHVKSDTTGEEFCTLDSLDQRAMGLACKNAVLKGNDFSFDVPVAQGGWQGTLSADGNTLTGTWTSGGKAQPLVFTRQAKALALPPIPPPTYDPATAPVKVADMQAVLTRDLAGALKNGMLAPSTGGGVSIGVVKDGVARVFSFGTARPNSIFEIGSITKTFTGLMLSQMVLQGEVKFDEPLRELLPPGTVAKPNGSEITLLDLATQHSGLPRMPDNFHPADPNNPYADYLAPNLYAYLHKHGVARPEHTAFLYSNLGFGTLGQALSNRAGVSYPELLQQEIAGPLGLKDTTVALSPDQKRRFIQGHDAEHRSTHPWDLVALAGAGAIRSDASDMLKYVEANLHPDQVKPVAGTKGAATISAALVQDHVLRADAIPGMRIALAWLYVEKTGTYWHNGGTGGFSSYAFFNPKCNCAGVVLFNTTVDERNMFADNLGEHIAQRFMGEPAISLGK